MTTDTTRTAVKDLGIAFADFKAAYDEFFEKADDLIAAIDEDHPAYRVARWLILSGPADEVALYMKDAPSIMQTARNLAR